MIPILVPLLLALIENRYMAWSGKQIAPALLSRNDQN